MIHDSICLGRNTGGVISQYKVPQNIDMQDRIVGPLTLYQFLYLLSTGMVFYATLKSPGVFDLILIGIPVGLLGMAFAFIKINDQPFSRFVISFLFYLLHPKTRVWHHGGGTPQISVTTSTQNQVKRITRKVLDTSRLQQMAQSLDK